jgi:DNA-binding transcriptional LysR family regulator
MRDLNDLAFFAAVVRHGGFAAAARALRLPKSSLSRRVARLEEELGVRLIERSTRRFSVTTVGSDFYRRCQALLEEAAAAENEVTRASGEPRGLVRVSCPLNLAQALANIIPGFLHRHPKVRVQLLVSNRRIDLIEERVDIAIRARARLDDDAALTMRALRRSRAWLVASPELLPQTATLQSPQALRLLPTLGASEQLGSEIWRLVGPDDREEIVEHEPRLASGDFAVVLEAAVAGLGVALMPEETCGAAIHAGRLVRVLPDWHAGEVLIHLVFTSRRGMLPAVRAFVDAIAEGLPEMCRLARERMAPAMADRLTAAPIRETGPVATGVSK